jgi:hypothetical protein
MTGIMAYNASARYSRGYWQAGFQQPWTMVTKRHAVAASHTDELDVCAGEVVAAGGYRYVWYLDANNVAHRATLKKKVRALAGKPGCPAYAVSMDMTMAIFDADMTDAIEPLWVVKYPDATTTAYYGWLPASIPKSPFTQYTLDVCSGWVPFLAVCQHSTCFFWGMGAKYPGDEAYVPGDSGSPEMLPLPDGRLAIFGLTSGAANSYKMQELIDQLTVSEGLNTADYQLKLVDLSLWPNL